MTSTIPFPELPKPAVNVQDSDPEKVSEVTSDHDLQQYRDRCSSTSSRKSLFSTSVYDPEDPYVRDLNVPVMLAAASINILIGSGLILAEASAIILSRLNFANGIFKNLAPGIWLGVFFVMIATLGLAIRSRFLTGKPVHYPVLSLYLGMNVVACVMSLGMIAYIAEVLISDRMTYQLCFGNICVFDRRVSTDSLTNVAPSGTANCENCDDTGLHDIFIIMLFSMVIAYLFVFIFAFATVKIAVRWVEFHTSYVRPQLKRFMSLAGRSPPRLPEISVYKI